MTTSSNTCDRTIEIRQEVCQEELETSDGSGRAMSLPLILSREGGRYTARLDMDVMAENIASRRNALRCMQCPPVPGPVGGDWPIGVPPEAVDEMSRAVLDFFRSAYGDAVSLHGAKLRRAILDYIHATTDARIFRSIG